MRAVLRLVPREVERHVFILVFLRVSAARDPSAAPRTHDERDVFVFVFVFVFDAVRDGRVDSSSIVSLESPRPRRDRRRCLLRGVV